MGAVQTISFCSTPHFGKDGVAAAERRGCQVLAARSGMQLRPHPQTPKRASYMHRQEVMSRAMLDSLEYLAAGESLQ